MATPELKFKVTAETEKAAQQVSQLGEKVVTGMKGASAATEAFSKILAAIENNTKTAAKGFDELGKSIGKVREKPPVDPKPVERFTGTIGVLVGRLPKLRDALLRATDPKQIERLNKIIGDTDARIRQLTGASQRGAGGIAQVGGASQRASFAVLNFGRIAQDSAFGFIGIANNIEPFVQSLTALKREAGSTGGAVKSFLSALGGPGAIGLIIGAISLFDAYSKGYGVFAGRTKGAAAASKEFADRQKEVAEAAKATANELAKEVVKIQSLAALANDENRSRGERLKAIEELRKAYPDYLRGLTNEEALSKGVAAATDAVTKSLIRRIVIEAARAKITKDISDALEKALARERLLAQQAPTVTKELGKQNTAYTEYIRNATGASDAAELFGKSARLATQDELGSFGQAQISANRILNQITPLFKSVGDVIAGLGGEVNDFSNSFGKVDKVTKDTATSTDALNSSWDSAIGRTITLNAQYQKLAGSAGIFRDVLEEINQENLTSEIASIANVARQFLQPSAPDVSGRGVSDEVTEAKARNDKALADTRTQIEGITNLIAGTLNSVLTDTFNAIANGQSPIKSITNALKQLVVRLLAAAAAAALLNALLPGASAAGGGFPGIFKQLIGLGGGGLPKFARGGVVSGPTPALIGEGGPEAVIPLSQLGRIFGMMGDRQDGPLVAVARGNDLYFANQRAGASYSRLFG